MEKSAVDTIAPPRTGPWDCTFALWKDGYAFIPRRCLHLKTDIFETRLLLQKTWCMSGPGWAQLFYDTSRFQRKHAVPPRVQKTLTGTGGVQMLDDKEHMARKTMFMCFMGQENIERLMQILERIWHARLSGWQRKRRIVLFTEMQALLCQAACEWTGVTVDEAEASAHARHLVAMIDGFGGIGPRYWRGKSARAASERWIGEIIGRIRKDEYDLPPESPAYRIAQFTGSGGSPLDAKVAAVDLLNLIRPIAAISYYAVFAALALQEHPQYRSSIRKQDGAFTDAFVQEVRRFYPFTPFLGATVREDFMWDNLFFPKERLVLLDIYGMLHDPRHWPDPQAFLPERFLENTPSPFIFIPQGGGDYVHGHRCAGEWITVQALKRIVSLLAQLEYDVPQQTLAYPLNRVPTFPQSGFIMENIR